MSGIKGVFLRIARVDERFGQLISIALIDKTVMWR